MSTFLLLILCGLVQAGPYDEASPLFGGANEGATTAGDPTGVDDPFRWVVEGVRVGDDGKKRVELRLVVPAGTHVYRDMVVVDVVEDGGLKVGKPDFPPGKMAADPANAKHERELYDLDVIIYVPLQIPAKLDGPAALTLELGHQGCRAGLCFPPTTRRESVVVTPVEAGT